MHRDDSNGRSRVAEPVDKSARPALTIGAAWIGL